MIFKGLAAFLLFLPALLAQGTTSRIEGTVEDPAHAAVANAQVRLTNQATKVSFTTGTSSAGSYVFDSVQPGTYQVQVEATGFKRFVSADNLVTIGQPTTLNVRLELGTVTEQVTVSGSAELVQTSTSGNLGNLVSQQAVEDLPVVATRGRNPLNLVIMQPGVVNGANTGGGSHAHGARDRAWNYTLDGIDVNDSSQGGSETTSFRINPDMLSEFRVLTGNNTAENGRNSGGQVAMVTRSGGNEYHGDAFWFYRTPRLNASEWQNNLDNLGKAQLQQNIYGGGIGGPIRKNRIFFFAEIQALRARSSSATARTVYTATARQGLLRYVKGGRNQPAGVTGASVDNSGNPLPGLNIGTYNVALSDPGRIGLDPTIQAMLKDMPLPNNFAVGDGLNTAGYNFSANASERQHDQTVKIDTVINGSNTLYGRVAWGRDDSLCDIVNGGQPVFPSQPCLVNTLRGPRNFAINWRTTINPSMTNELVIGENRYDPIFGQPASLDKITFLSTPVDNTAQYDFGNQRVVSTWQLVDNFSWSRGPHNFKFGANLRRVREEDQRGSVAGLNATEEINFSTGINTVDPTAFGIPTDVNTAFDRPIFQTNINYLLGRVGQIQRGFVANGNQWAKSTFQFDTRYPELEFYGQDSWKVRPNLTIDAGLRWEIRLAPNSPTSNILVPNQPIVAGAAPSNTISWVPGDLFKNQMKNFGPSLGFAWDPSGSGKTSIRANYRIAFDRINDFVVASTILPNLPGAAFAAINTDFGQSGGRLSSLPALLPPTAAPSTLTQPAAFSSASNTVIDPNLKTPTTHQWDLNFQREIAKNTILDIAYVGRRAYHLLGAYNVNQDQIYSNGFLDAFNTIKAGGESSAINSLLSADTRLNAGETPSAMIRRLYSSNLNLNSVGALANSLATRLQGTQSVTALSAGKPFFFIPYTQYSGGLNVLDSNDFSTYNALEVQLERRLTSGISFHVGYTWSKSLDTRSFDPTLTVVGTGNASTAADTPLDINNRRLNYAPSDFDRRHSLQTNWVVELPFGRGKRFLGTASGLGDRIAGGWEVTGFGRVTSGRPFTVFSGSNTVSNVNQSTANCNNCRPGDGSPFLQSPSGLIWYFDAAELAKFSAPGAGEFGNSGRNFFVGPHYVEIDASLLKRVSLTERFKLELRGDATNLTNTVAFGPPTTDITSGTFGRIRNNVTSGSRKIQLGAKIRF
ncbi:MAG: Plug and carboxypeptidase regulatory-like domain-containing protein [Acidobacteriota bacterium]|nr:Plug and carboxypeptidase regulatory-like domain-containing protein [Acidobacteriota bacterium]